MRKPAPALFHAACAALVPAETLMVGDDPLSDGGAAAAGLRVYLLAPDARGASRGLSAVVALVGSLNPPTGGGHAGTPS